MTTSTKYLGSQIKRALLAAGLATAFAAPIWAQAPDADAAVDPEAALMGQWRENMANVPTPDEGCYHASYPDLFWEQVDCRVGAPRVPPVHAQPSGDEEVVGNGHDYVAEAKGLITFAGGSFTTKGVKTEKSVGVASFGGGGILGSNEYTLQINTNASDTTSVCDKHKDCTVWQQFVYATNYYSKGEAAVFIEYWLLNWGTSACPKGWSKYHEDCVINSKLTKAPNFGITDLSELSFSSTARAGGNDQALLVKGKEAWSMTAKDNVLDISSVWHEAEFNVLGDAGGSRADFNNGSDINVTLVLLDGSTAAPKCVNNAGTTGETNNLNLGTCKASGGIPNIKFGESN
jgi:hypothetical protein